MLCLKIVLKTIIGQFTDEVVEKKQISLNGTLRAPSPHDQTR